jgi:hypothetical protein
VRGSFEDLDVYVLVVELADEVRAWVHAWGPMDQWSSGMQLMRAVE